MAAGWSEKEAKKAVKTHIRRIGQQLRQALQRQADAQLLDRLKHRNDTDPFSKTSLLYARHLEPGPPLHIALNWVGRPAYRAAVSALFGGDLCLGRYAGNFFAKQFTPQSRNHVADSEQLGIDPKRVCISCWHYRRQLVQEGEGHVFMECPTYVDARSEFLASLHQDTNDQIRTRGSGDEKLLYVVSSHKEGDWQALGRFASKIQQSRRRIRRRFQEMSDRLEQRGYDQKAACWRRSGGFVCRHGICFTSAHGPGCSCTNAHNPADAWTHARWMPYIDTDMRKIVMVPFDLGRMCRIGKFRAEMRRLNFV